MKKTDYEEEIKKRLSMSLFNPAEILIEQFIDDVGTKEEAKEIVSDCGYNLEIGKASSAPGFFAKIHSD